MKTIFGRLFCFVFIFISFLLIVHPPTYAAQMVADPILVPLRYDPNNLNKTPGYDTTGLYGDSVKATNDDIFNPDFITDGDTSLVDVYFLLDENIKKSSETFYFCFKSDSSKCLQDPSKNLWEAAKDQTASVGVADKDPVGAMIMERFGNLANYDTTTVGSDNLIHVRVCGNGDSDMRAWGQCDTLGQNSGYNNLWFHAGKTYQVTLYQSDKGGSLKKNDPQLNEIGSARFYVHNHYPLVYIDPVDPSGIVGKFDSGTVRSPGYDINTANNFSLLTPKVSIDPSTHTLVTEYKGGVTPDKDGNVTLRLHKDLLPLNLEVRLAGRVGDGVKDNSHKRGDYENNYRIDLANDKGTVNMKQCVTIKHGDDGTFLGAINNTGDKNGFTVFSGLPAGRYQMNIYERTGEDRSRWQKGIGAAIVGGTAALTIGAATVLAPGVGTAIAIGGLAAVGGATGITTWVTSNSCDTGFLYWSIQMEVIKIKPKDRLDKTYKLVVTEVNKDPNGADFIPQQLGLQDPGIPPGCVVNDTKNPDNNYDPDLHQCNAVDTAIGRFPTDPSRFVTALLDFVLTLAGTISIILMIVAGYQLMISQGDKQKLQAARERITSLIIGLLFIIFSLVILQFITINVLKIPGFS